MSHKRSVRLIKYAIVGPLKFTVNAHNVEKVTLLQARYKVSRRCYLCLVGDLIVEDLALSGDLRRLTVEL